MTAEGYKSEPLSEEMERRIRARIDRYRNTPRSELAVAALEWILHEADAMKLEPPAIHSRFNPLVCPICDHEHEGRTECAKYLGEGKFCQCEEKVTA